MAPTPRGLRAPAWRRGWLGPVEWGRRREKASLRAARSAKGNRCCAWGGGIRRPDARARARGIPEQKRPAGFRSPVHRSPDDESASPLRGAAPGAGGRPYAQQPLRAAQARPTAARAPFGIEAGRASPDRVPSSAVCASVNRRLAPETADDSHAQAAACALLVASTLALVLSQQLTSTHTPNSSISTATVTTTAITSTSILASFARCGTATPTATHGSSTLILTGRTCIIGTATYTSRSQWTTTRGACARAAKRPSEPEACVGPGSPGTGGAANAQCARATGEAEGTHISAESDPVSRPLPYPRTVGGTGACA
jgi:hypothetical protein